MMKSKKQFRIFTIVDCDKEEDYLHDMHLKGWKFVGCRFCFYHFEQCQPEDMIYRVCDSRCYRKYEKVFQEFRDRGWEFVEACPYSVFRKPVATISSEDSQIYKNNHYRWKMVSSRLRSSIVAVLSGLLILLVGLFREDFSLSSILLLGIYGLMIASLVYGFLRLRKKCLLDET